MTLESLVRRIERRLFDGRYLTRHGVKMFGRCVRVSENTIEIATPNKTAPGFNSSVLIIGFFSIERVTFRPRDTY
jgi:hypothetical protein